MRKKLLSIVLAITLLACMIPMGALTAFAGTGYTLEDNTATLEKGYMWSDGTFDSKGIKFTIAEPEAKAKVTITESGATAAFNVNDGDEVEEGSEIQLTELKALGGYESPQVSINSTPIDIGGTYTVTESNIEDGVNIVVTADAVENSIFVNLAEGGGDVYADPENYYISDEAQTVMLTAEPAEGYVFSGWILNAVAYGSATIEEPESAKTMMTIPAGTYGEILVGAKFAEVPKVRVTIDESGAKATLNVNNGDLVAEGFEILLTDLKALDGYMDPKVIINDILIGVGETYTVKEDDFVRDIIGIHVTADAEYNHITVFTDGGEGEAYVDYGIYFISDKAQTVMLTAEPAEGYVFSGWILNAVAHGSATIDEPESATTTMTIAEGTYGNIDVTAVFKALHTHTAGTTYMHNADAHWYACCADGCDLITVADYELAFADSTNGATLKTTLGYEAHSFTDGKCKCGYRPAVFITGEFDGVSKKLGFETFDEAMAALGNATGTDPYIITLNEDVAARETVGVFPENTNINVILDLNGYTLTCDEAAEYFNIAFGTMLIMDGSGEGTGTVLGHVVVNSQLTIEKGTFVDEDGFKVYGELTVIDGRFNFDPSNLCDRKFVESDGYYELAADYTVVNDAIANAEEITDSKLYTAESWAKFREAQKKAENINQNLNFRHQPEVEDAANALIYAIGNLDKLSKVKYNMIYEITKFGGLMARQGKIIDGVVNDKIGRTIIPLTKDQLDCINEYIWVVGFDGYKEFRVRIDCAYTWFYNDGDKIVAGVTPGLENYAAFIIIDNDGTDNDDNTITGFGYYRIYNDEIPEDEEGAMHDALYLDPKFAVISKELRNTAWKAQIDVFELGYRDAVLTIGIDTATLSFDGKDYTFTVASFSDPYLYFTDGGDNCLDIMIENNAVKIFTGTLEEMYDIASQDSIEKI